MAIASRRLPWSRDFEVTEIENVYETLVNPNRSIPPDLIMRLDRHFMGNGTRQAALS